MIHTGSRGLGHQICTDHVAHMQSAMSRYGITVPDRQLACVPIRSPEGEVYLAAMAAAANYRRANRQLLSQATRAAFARILGTGDTRPARRSACRGPAGTGPLHGGWVGV